MFCKKQKPKKNSAIVLFHVFVPVEKKNKCQNARAELAEFSSSSVERAALCTCSDLHLRGVRSISARKNFRRCFGCLMVSKVRTCGFKLLRENVTEQRKQRYQVNGPLFACFQEIQESIRNREPQLNLIRKQSGEFVSHGKQIMEPYKRLLDRRWDDLAARIGELEKELEDAKRQAEQGRAMGGRVETEIIVKVRTRSFTVLLLCFCLKTNGIHRFLCVFFTHWPHALQPERISTRLNARPSEISVEMYEMLHCNRYLQELSLLLELSIDCLDKDSDKTQILGITLLMLKQPESLRNSYLKPNRFVSVSISRRASSLF